MSNFGTDEQKAIDHLKATTVNRCPEFHRWQLRLDDPSFTQRLDDHARFVIEHGTEWLEKVRGDDEGWWRAASMMRKPVIELADAVVAFRVAGRQSTDHSLAQAILRFEEENDRMTSEVRARQTRRADSE